jgi:aminocarboxymuconate-semialdehyde decarboxylase
MRPETEIEDLDARGIDVAVVTSSTVLQGTSWADPQTDLELCRRCNDTTADWVAKYPRRFVGSIVLPLQDVGLALGELERGTRELGLRVVNAGASYNGVYWAIRVRRVLAAVAISI